MAALTFVSLFEQNQDALKASLEGCSLPKDAQKIQSCVTNYLSEMFDSNGELRMSLTQSEDYILQAAISLLNAQQKMASAFAEEAVKSANAQPKKEDEPALDLSAKQALSNTTILSGSAIGGIGGGLIFGTWGAVFGAIAGTALVLYMSTADKKQQPPKSTIKKPVAPADVPINTDAYIEIIRNICQSIDTLIDTFRAQIKRVVQKYEAQEKPTLESDYQELLGNIQSLLGAYSMDASNDNRGKRIEQRIEALADSLENYDLQAVNYDGTNRNLFNFLPSPNVTEETMVTPAITKNGVAVMKGKVFTKE